METLLDPFWTLMQVGFPPGTGLVGACCLGAFLLGAVPFSFLVGKARGVDLRQVGSGNVGATNLARSRGLRWAVIAFLLDAGKGTLPVLVLSALAPAPPWPAVLAGGSAVLGHCFSPYLRFRGGKGVATTAGVLAALNPRVFLALLALWGGASILIRNIGIASSLAALGGAGLGAWLLLRPGARPDEAAFAAFLLVLSVLVILRHVKNIGGFLRQAAREPGR
ncbi:MAG: glycerol-3-phosphate acyltransferase [Planctomycetota bacterium]